MSNDVLVNLEATEEKYTPTDQETDLISWITQVVEPWRTYRDTNFKQRWDEYYRLWRGVFKESDRTRSSERSKLISPALSQAVEAMVSEVEEAIFGSKGDKWFDASQDVIDNADANQRAILDEIIKRLREDVKSANITQASAEAFLLGTLFGTGIAKVNVKKVPFFVLNDKMEIVEDQKWQVGLEPVDPREFLADPTARGVDDSLGAAQEMIVSKADILEKMSNGVYRKVEVGTTGEPDGTMEEESQGFNLNNVKILEYHGFVPESLLPTKVADDSEYEEFEKWLKKDDEDGLEVAGDKLVEAIVVIANESILLKGVRNPLPRNDRSYVAYQHDTVPNRFWGRGVGEKGYNPQKALDGELRARMDAMAYAVHPMVGLNATMMPRGSKLSVGPGKSVLFNGNPAEAMQPFTFGKLDPNVFPVASDLERMVQMATGAIDTQAAPGSGGPSASVTASIKRTKRTLANIERNFVEPMIHKIAHRYFFFDKERYPIKDMKFQVHTGMGMMAKEVESQQYMNMLKTVDSQSPGYWMLMKGVYQNSSLSNREEMVAIADKMLQATMNPPPPAPDPMVEVTKLDIQSRERTAQMNARVNLLSARAKLMEVMIKKQKADAEEANLDADSVLKLAKADAEDLNAEISAYIQEVDSMKEQSTKEENINEPIRDTGEISEGDSGRTENL